MLTKTEKRDLASKINSLMVAAMMRETCDSKDTWIWSRAEEEKVVELFDQYGIELPNLAMYLQERASKVRILTEVA